MGRLSGTRGSHVVGVVGLFCLLGCGAAESDGGSASGDEALDPRGAENAPEPLGSQAQKLDEGLEDRAPAAAVLRHVIGGSGVQVWVFACDQNFRIVRKIRDEWNSWGAWKTIASTKNCAGAPVVAYFENYEESETLLLYWRDFNFHLYEVRFFPDGHTTTTNVSVAQGLGRMGNFPVIANLGNDTGAMNAIALPYVKYDANNELWTVEYKAGVWVTRPVLRADGSTASVPSGTQFVTAFGPPSGVYDRTFISAQGEGNQHFIFARRSWGVSYREYASTNTTAVKGQLSIAHYDLFDGDPTCYPRGCAMYRDAESDMLMYAGLASGGDLTNRFSLWEDKHPEAAAEPSHWPWMGSSLGANPERSWYPYGWANGRGALVQFIFSTGSTTVCSGAGVISRAPVAVMNTYYQILFQDSFGWLRHFDYSPGQGCGARNIGITDLGLRPLGL
jgi:hypothetical protein